MTAVYYNDSDPFACAWLRELIGRGLLPDGEVDERPIESVSGNDLRGFSQCHFFAGIGGWAHALALAGWPQEREVWTGSCPCQPLSVAGQRRGHADERHLWPAFHRLIAGRRPAVLLGEQVASKDGREWFAGVRADLERAGYACWGAIMPACAVGAPHRRERLFFVADRPFARREAWRGDGLRIEQDNRQGFTARYGDAGERLADAGSDGRGQHAQFDGDAEQSGFGAPRRDDAARRGGHERVGDAGEPGFSFREAVGGEALGAQGGFSGRDAGIPNIGGFWSDAVWLAGADGKARRVKPGVRLLVDGVPNRVGALRGFGNAIVPQVAAEFVGAYLDI